MEFTVYDINSSNEGGKTWSKSSIFQTNRPYLFGCVIKFCSFSKRLIKNGNGSTLTK